MCPQKAARRVGSLRVSWAFPVLGLKVLVGAGGAARSWLGLSRMDMDLCFYYYLLFLPLCKRGTVRGAVASLTGVLGAGVRRTPLRCAPRGRVSFSNCLIVSAPGGLVRHHELLEQVLQPRTDCAAIGGWLRSRAGD